MKQVQSTDTNADRPGGRRKCILILGMHRSGTSAIGGLLSQLGLDVGNNLMPANKYNEKGYFEDLDVVELNDKILRANGRVWDSFFPFTPEVTAYFKEAIKSLYNKKFGSASICVMKDPRFSLTLPVWLSALREIQVQCYAIVTLRNPIEVGRSLAIREKMSMTRSLLLWANYTAHAEYYTRDIDGRMLVDYENLLANPNRFLKGVLQMISLKTVDLDRARNFIDVAMNHHKDEGKGQDQFSTSHLSWIIESYDRIKAKLNSKAFDNLIPAYNQLLEELYSKDIASGISADVNFPYSRLFLNSGEGFNDNAVLKVPFGRYMNSFAVTFQGIGKFGNTVSLRWNPITGRFIKLNITRISVVDFDGVEHSIPRERWSTNGIENADHTFDFYTDYPSLEIQTNFPIDQFIAVGQVSFLEKGSALEAVNKELIQTRKSYNEAERLLEETKESKELLGRRLEKAGERLKSTESLLFGRTEELNFYRNLQGETPTIVYRKWVNRLMFRLGRLLGTSTLHDSYLTHPLVFDAEYYINASPQLTELSGSPSLAQQHWISKGVYEGLPASPAFHVKYYLQQNDDLRNWFKNDYGGAIKHWVDYGVAEGRKGSPEFDVRVYKARYKDVEGYGNDFRQLTRHWIKVGRVEGRNAVENGSTEAAKQVVFNGQKSASRRIVRMVTEWDWDTESLFKAQIDVLKRKHEGYFSRVPVSIVMPTYNRANSIRRAIESVMAQTHGNWELLIVDDGSTDATATAIEPFLQDTRVSLLKLAHVGVAGARNSGLEMARGEFVFYLDSDNMWDQSFLEYMILYMVMGNLDAAYCGIRIVGEDLETKAYRGAEFIWSLCYKQNYVDMNCFGHRRVNLFRHRFDQSLKRLVDWDFILRITARSRAAFMPMCAVVYYDGEEGSRITHTEYPGEELRMAEDQIRQKHNLKDVEAHDAKYLRPDWNDLLNDDNILNDEISRPLVKLGTELIDWVRLKQQSREKGLVSVIVLCYNNSAMSYNCIQSILEARASTAYKTEIIAVDNGSTDNTAEVLERLSAVHPSVTAVRAKENLMFSLGNNLGLAHSTGDYVVFLNNDTLVTSHWLDPLIDSLRLDPTLGAVGPKLLYEDGTMQCGGLVFSSNSKIPYHIYKGFEKENPVVNKSRLFQALTGACIAFRADDLVMLQGLDPIFVNGCEDLDICFRLRSILKKSSLYNPKSEIIHLESKSEGRGQHIMRNRVKFVERWGGFVRADDADFYDEDGFTVRSYRKPGTELDGETASYVPEDLGKATPPARIGSGAISNIGFCSIWHPRGIAFHTRQIAESLEGSQFRTHIFARWESDRFLNEGPIYHPRVFNAGDDPTEESIVSWIKSNDIQMMIFMEVHDRDWKRVEAAKRLNIPVVCYENLDILKKERMERYAIFDFFLFNSFYSRSVFLSQFPGKRSLMIPWGVEAQSMQTQPAGGQIKFVHVAGWGGVNNRKNTDLLIRAFHRSSADAQLHIYTQRSLEAYEGDIVAICKSDERFEVHQGTIENINEAYQNKSMLLWPSKKEGVGLPILEALINGLPVMVTDGYMMKQWIIGETHGTMIPARPLPDERMLPELQIDGEVLVSAIESIASDKEKLNNLRQNVVRDREHWTWSWQPAVMKEQIFQVLENKAYRFPDDLSYIPRNMLEFEFSRRCRRFMAQASNN